MREADPEGSDPPSDHIRHEITQHIRIIRVIHMIVIVKVTVNDSPLADQSQIQLPRDMNPLRSVELKRLVGSEPELYILDAVQLMILNPHEPPDRGRLRHDLVAAPYLIAPVEADPAALAPPRRNLDLVAGVKRIIQTHIYPAEQKRPALVPELLIRRTKILHLQIRRLLHISQHKRSPHDPRRVAVMSIDTVFFRPFHSFESILSPDSTAAPEERPPGAARLFFYVN